MKAYLITGLLGLSALAFSMNAAADESGFFVRGSAGKAKTDAGILDQSDKAFGIGAGYRFNRYFGIDGNYVDLGKPEKTIGSGATATRLSLDSKTYLLGITGYLPLGGEDSGFELRAKAGFAILDTEGSIRTSLTGASVKVKDNGKSPYFGIGAGYRFNENLTAGVELTRIKSEVKTVSGTRIKFDDNRNMVAAFVEYKF
jgi:OmpA-OmpF porin, OOP family